MHGGKEEKIDLFTNDASVSMHSFEANKSILTLLKAESMTATDETFCDVFLDICG